MFRLTAASESETDEGQRESQAGIESEMCVLYVQGELFEMGKGGGL